MPLVGLKLEVINKDILYILSEYPRYAFSTYLIYTVLI